MKQQIITIAQQKGGVGKTTITAHLAVEFVNMNLRVAVIDVDPQSSLTMWHQIREKNLGETGIHFISTTGWRISSEISRLKEDYDIIIIDSPPHTDTEAKTAIRAADLVIIPLQPSPTDFWATEATINIAKKENKEFVCLLNRVSNNSRLARDIAVGLPNLLERTISNRVGFASALLEGKCVTETEPKSNSADEVRDLVAEVTNILKQISAKKKTSVR